MINQYQLKNAWEFITQVDRGVCLRVDLEGKWYVATTIYFTDYMKPKLVLGHHNDAGDAVMELARLMITPPEGQAIRSNDKYYMYISATRTFKEVTAQFVRENVFGNKPSNKTVRKQKQEALQ